MIRPYLYAAVLAAILGAGWWLYQRGADNARTDQLERTLEDADTTNKGAADAAACDWYKWVSGGCDRSD